MDLTARLAKLQEAMMASGLDVLVYGLGANFQYFTGLPVRWQRMKQPDEPGCFLVLSRDQAPRTVLHISYAALAAGSHIEVDLFESRGELPRMLRDHIRGKQAGVSRTAAAYLTELVTTARPGIRCVDAEPIGEALRMVKDPAEIESLRKAVALTDQVMAKVVESIRPGITQPQLQTLIAQTGRAVGAEDVSFEPAALFVRSDGEPTAEPFVYPRDKGLVPGTSVAFDFGFVLDGYCSDFGRSFYCGRAPEYVKGAYRALHESQGVLIGQMRSGETKLSEMFGILEAAMDDRGSGDYLRARLKDGTLGHQIGVDLHEHPWIRPGSDVLLEPGMVMAIEPKAWFSGEYYLRVEDIVLVTEDGAECLTGFSREMFELPAR